MMLIKIFFELFLAGAMIVFMFIGMGTVWYLFTKGGGK